MTSPTWSDADEPEIEPPTIWGWVRAGLRALPLILVIGVGLVILLLLRLVERPLFGMARPVTPWITVAVCRIALVVLGLGYSRTGEPMRHKGALVANHSSWLDIFVLNAAAPLYFVSKADVAGWPGIGTLAKSVGTVFIARNRQEAKLHNAVFEDRLLAGHTLLFFPEGTSTDGLRVLPFKPTLFQAFFSDSLEGEIAVQPVTVIYHAPVGEPANFYGWWGEMEFGAHLVHTLAARRQGRVEVHYSPPILLSAAQNRKLLAAECEAQIRAIHAKALTSS
ncbi:1-acyl-sn-glycerol-3-phosphate acyltransferase [Aliishimia ponticola]|uniref:1-acyl-sn-glycerol-3-phosphate acyltransferase n=1 Tax=Aliishimia ponticola TaxID=2499833 RepID=A0A4V3XKW1_9RHOB|nr:lysophospholipid acyltransferase family protein [Aliishimia ponticola]THH38513.1 1-acyl-sn-glycerol-3-phosphate acyltransferase [Aliishimia ponticola]